jgi:hypothetical protein
MSSVLAETLATIINTSIKHGVVPEAWKLSRIIPLHKATPSIYLKKHVIPMAGINAKVKITARLLTSF